MQFFYGPTFQWQRQCDDRETLPSIECAEPAKKAEKSEVRCAYKPCSEPLPYVEDDGKLHYCWSCRQSGYDK